MAEYLDCLKLVQGDNALNCRLLAKKYLGCRMDNQLMDRDDWKHLGLPDDKTDQSTGKPVETKDVK
jgi:cytochrome c oxidase assembly protein subunit 19